VLFLRAMHYAFRTDTCQLVLKVVLTKGELFREWVLSIVLSLDLEFQNW